MRNPDGVQVRATVRNPFPIATMLRKGNITARQYEAGDKLNRYYYKYTGQQSCMPRERLSGGNKQIEMTANQIDGWARYNTGLEAAGGEQSLIIQVCIEETPLTTHNMGGHQKIKLKERFCNALDRVATAYHL